MAKPSSKWKQFERFEAQAYWAEFSHDGLLTFSKGLAAELAIQNGVALLFNRDERILAARIPTKDDRESIAAPHAARQNSVYVRPAMSSFGIKPCRLSMSWDAGLGAWTGKVA